MSAKLKVKRGTTEGWKDATKNTLESGQLGIEYRGLAPYGDGVNDFLAPRVKVGPHSDTPTHWDAIAEYLAPDASVYQDHGISPANSPTSGGTFWIGDGTASITMVSGGDLDLMGCDNVVISTGPASAGPYSLYVPNTIRFGDTTTSTPILNYNDTDKTITIGTTATTSTEISNSPSIDMKASAINLTGYNGMNITADWIIVSSTVDIGGQLTAGGYPVADIGTTSDGSNCVVFGADYVPSVIKGGDSVDIQSSSGLKLSGIQALSYDDMYMNLQLGNSSDLANVSLKTVEGGMVTLESDYVRVKKDLDSMTPDSNLGTSADPWGNVYTKAVTRVCPNRPRLGSSDISSQITDANVDKFIISSEFSSTDYVYLDPEEAGSSGVATYYKDTSSLMLLSSFSEVTVPPTSYNYNLVSYYRKGIGLFRDQGNNNLAIVGVVGKKSSRVESDGTVTEENEETFSLDNNGTITIGTSQYPLGGGFFRSLGVRSYDTSGNYTNVPVPAIHIGTSAPNALLGKRGDVYIQYIA